MKSDNITLSYLNLQTPAENRGNSTTFFIIALDLLGVLPILGNPFSFSYFMATIISLSVLSILTAYFSVSIHRYFCIKRNMRIKSNPSDLQTRIHT